MKKIFYLGLVFSFFLSLFFNIKSYTILENIVEEDQTLEKIEEVSNEMIEDGLPNGNCFITMDEVLDNSTLLTSYNKLQFKKNEEKFKKIEELAEVCNDEIKEKIKAEEKRIVEEKARKIAEEKNKQTAIRQQTQTNNTNNNNVSSEMRRRNGMIGRLTIPSVGVNVALFKSSLQNVNTAQIYVDNSDSAAYYDDFGSSKLIADHNYQGFNGIKKAVPYQTKAYINNGYGMKEYICTANFKGHNTGEDLTDNNGHSVEYANPGGIIMYTCNENWKNVTITYWQAN